MDKPVSSNKLVSEIDKEASRKGMKPAKIVPKKVTLKNKSDTATQTDSPARTNSPNRAESQDQVDDEVVVDKSTGMRLMRPPATKALKPVKFPGSEVVIAKRNKLINGYSDRLVNRLSTKQSTLIEKYTATIMSKYPDNKADWDALKLKEAIERHNKQVAKWNMLTNEERAASIEKYGKVVTL